MGWINNDSYLPRLQIVKALEKKGRILNETFYTAIGMDLAVCVSPSLENNHGFRCKPSLLNRLPQIDLGVTGVR